MEIVYIIKGRTKQVINGKDYDCEEGDFLFFYVGDKHGFEPIGETSLINVAFDPKLMHHMELNRYFPIDKKIDCVVKLPRDDRIRAVSILRMMQYEYKSQKEGYICIVQNLLQSLVCILLRYGYYKSNFDERVQEMMRIITENCNISINEIVNVMGYSGGHLSRIFKTATGISIKDYINKSKMLKAYDLVKETGLSVEKVMEMVDLSNKTHFYKLFNKYIGKNPGECRKK
jgi:YesN/AraC family two-component response regulator